MEHQCSLPCSQGSATGSCAEPVESNSHPHTLLLNIHGNITFTAYLSQNTVSYSSLPFVLRVSSIIILFDFITINDT